LADGGTDADADAELRSAAATAVAGYHDAMRRFHLDEALGAMNNLVRAGNGYAESQAPWSLHKAGETERLAQVLAAMAEACRILGHLVAPFTPASAARLHDQLGVPVPYDRRGSGGPGLDALLAWGAVRGGWTVGTAEPLFPRTELPTEVQA
jgi:methionyl-tRNA synthetase